ncbi:hypothetical protein AB0A96_44845, partial [Streptomyces asiaticus]|uniref:hypothetical protein n=1 Tax=Streptomyces asiaticus TaxID=114695 RepID=UPI0033D23408
MDFFPGIPGNTTNIARLAGCFDINPGWELLEFSRIHDGNSWQFAGARRFASCTAGWTTLPQATRRGHPARPPGAATRRGHPAR